MPFLSLFLHSIQFNQLLCHDIKTESIDCGNFECQINGNQLMITAYYSMSKGSYISITGTEEELKLIETVYIDYYTMYTPVGIKSFKNLVSLQTIKLPDFVENVPKDCFSGCTSLKSIEFQAETITLYEGSFNGVTALETLGFSGEVINIPEFTPPIPSLVNIMFSNPNTNFQSIPSTITKLIFNGFGELSISGDNIANINELELQTDSTRGTKLNTLPSNIQKITINTEDLVTIPADIIKSVSIYVISKRLKLEIGGLEEDTHPNIYINSQDSIVFDEIPNQCNYIILSEGNFELLAYEYYANEIIVQSKNEINLVADITVESIKIDTDSKVSLDLDSKDTSVIYERSPINIAEISEEVPIIVRNIDTAVVKLLPNDAELQIYGTTSSFSLTFDDAFQSSKCRRWNCIFYSKIPINSQTLS